MCLSPADKILILKVLTTNYVYPSYAVCHLSPTRPRLLSTVTSVAGRIFSTIRILLEDDEIEYLMGLPLDLLKALRSALFYDVEMLLFIPEFRVAK